MNKIVAVSVAAAVPTIAPAEALQGPDPIFAALDAFRLADENFYADHPEWDGNIPDEIGDQWSRARGVVIRTQPTTPAGLGALTSFAREMAERTDRGDAGFADKEWIPVMAAIDDAARGMSGLQPWTPPQSAIAPAAPILDRSPAASLARAEQVVTLLRTCYIREGWKIDDEAAEVALAYCRRYAADGSDPDEERMAAIDFFLSHGVSIDWVFGGDVGGLICRVAKHSQRADAAALSSTSEQG